MTLSGGAREMQHVINVLTPATSHQLISLDEMKAALRLGPSDTTHDAELIMVIDGISRQIARMANRVFGFEKVEETIYSTGENQRLFLSRWPVKYEDIETIGLDDSDISTDTGWVLEEETGTLYRPASFWNGKLNIRYSGGYKLPDEAPNDLKRAAQVVGREDYFTYLRGAMLSGVRMISHKGARVQYYPQGGEVSKTGGGGGGATWRAVESVIRPYIRHWV
jgi:hypothetical protein